MHKLYCLSVCIFSVLSCLILSRAAMAEGGVLISQIQINNSSNSRLVELYNNTDASIDVTNYCVFHSSATEISAPDKLACFENVDSAGNVDKSLHLILRARSYALIGSEELGIPADLLMVGGLGGATGGHVYLVDQSENELDRIGWGTAAHPEGLAAKLDPMNISHVLERKMTDAANEYQDTNINADDFSDSTLRQKTETTPGYLIGNIDEVVDMCINQEGIQVLVPDGYVAVSNGECQPIVVDICPNLDEVQLAVPDGYERDEGGNCMVDTCPNIEGLQIILPQDMETDENGDCVTATDKCPNLAGLQVAIPAGYELNENGDCTMGLLPLQITEMLPNPSGDDVSHEFIEIYNPNEVPIDLSSYRFYFGSNEDGFAFPKSLIIEPGQYLVITDEDVSYRLTNTGGSIRIVGIDNILIAESEGYTNAADDMSWALIDSNWQYTNRPTPGEDNLVSLFEEKSPELKTDSTLALCPEGQYRNPETNRCKKYETTVSTLVPCKDGYYRSEETNRCRSIVAEVSELTACSEGEERNPETNRCRKIAEVLSDNDLKPCEQGYERNPETNRCRKIVSTVIPQVGYAPEPTAASNNNPILWWSFGAVGLGAICYGIWEWRAELKKAARRLGILLHLIK